MLEVVAGVIWNQAQDELLLTLRKPGQHQENLWEFPGGKLEAGESQIDGLSRELTEELGLKVVRASALKSVSHKYPDKSVLIHFWNVYEFEGEPVAREAQLMQWVKLDRLADLAFPAANQPVVEAIINK